MLFPSVDYDVTRHIPAEHEFDIHNLALHCAYATNAKGVTSEHVLFAEAYAIAGQLACVATSDRLVALFEAFKRALNGRQPFLVGPGTYYLDRTLWSGRSAYRFRDEPESWRRALRRDAYALAQADGSNVIQDAHFEEALRAREEAAQRKWEEQQSRKGK